MSYAIIGFGNIGHALAKSFVDQPWIAPSHAARSSITQP
jgi:predicted dinucleotide-binding enzyme